jgi:signal transduction histidine kinase
VALAAVAAGEWLRDPGWLAAILTGTAAAAALLGFRRAGRNGEAPLIRLALFPVLAALALSSVAVQWRLTAIEHRWSALRERELGSATRTLSLRLDEAVLAARRLADEAVLAAAGNQGQAFIHLERATSGSGPELAAVVLDSDGAPWAWAGRHWERPRTGGDSVEFRSNAYWAGLELRRPAPLGRTVEVEVLLWSHPLLPVQTRSFAELFRQETDVRLQFEPAAEARNGSELLLYSPRGATQPWLAVRAIPPEQGAAKESALQRGRELVAWSLILALGLALLLAKAMPERYGLLLILLWVAGRSPLGPALKLDPLFSPATYFHPLLGPLSASAGVLAMAGIIATAAGISVWERGLRRQPWTIALGATLLLAAPYLISELSRGITPPAGGVRSGLWLTWQMAMVFPAAACVAVAAALFRGSAERDPPAWRAILGAVLAILITLAGVALYGPGRGWRDFDWYPLLWALPLFLVALPAPRWAMVAGLGLVAGSAAALVTWGEDLNGRLQVAARDVASLGGAEDPIAIPVLQWFGDEVRSAPAPTSAAELFTLWRGSRLQEQDYPARLALWSSGGAPQAELDLDSLDVPGSVVSALVRGLEPTTTQEVIPMLRVPGMHYLLLERLSTDRVLTVAIGPRSRLIVPDRLGRLLEAPPGGEPPYELSLSPPAPGTAADSGALHWSRDGWALRSDRRLLLPGGSRHVYAQLDLRGPVPLLVRGALVVLADTAILSLLWWLVLGGGDSRRPSPLSVVWRGVSRSFQGRLAVTLALFFIIPVAGFTAWNLARLRVDAQRGRDLLITQVLRDAVLATGGLVQGPPDVLPQGLQEMGSRLDAELALYSGGNLVAGSSALLTQLGLLDVLLDPEAFRAMALSDELEITRTGRPSTTPMRIGYRVVQPGPPDSVGVLATPQQAALGPLRLNELDLALVLLLATLIGLAAASVAAQLVARALSRPVATLRQSAVAVGQGLPPVVSAVPPPVEFETVFRAFDRMAADIRTSQAALEAARRRTASVLATVATGVVALDDEGRVLLANQRARDILGLELREGTELGATLAEDWKPLGEAIRDLHPHPGGNPVSTEFDVGGHRLRLQLTALGTEPGGTVLAIDDLTGITQAERILAWGEMARQVAHEIKNPLTPIRLGVQHLRRAFRDRRADFSGTLDDTTSRILSEIDRLDAIARGFSRFAAPAPEATPLEEVELVGAVSEVVQLYSLGGESDGDGSRVRLEAKGRQVVPGRANEVKEVMVNLLENARNAKAREVVVRVGDRSLSVADDGTGISPDLLPRIFEPRFSATTSGSGLGLAIVRRLVNGWGAVVEVESEVGRGTTVSVRWPDG